MISLEWWRQCIIRLKGVNRLICFTSSVSFQVYSWESKLITTIVQIRRHTFTQEIYLQCYYYSRYIDPKLLKIYTFLISVINNTTYSAINYVIACGKSCDWCKNNSPQTILSVFILLGSVIVMTFLFPTH